MRMIILLAALLVLPSTATAQKVFLNYSDQSNTVSGGGLEKDYATIIAGHTRDILTANGFTLRLNQSFYDCNADANSWGAQVFMSIHSNAGGGHGPESWFGVPSGSQAFASKIQSGLTGKLPYQSRGVKDASDGRYRVLRLAQQPACLPEVVFHDCTATSGYAGHPPSESAYLRSDAGQRAIAAGLANGVCQHFKGANCSGGSTPANGSIKGVVYKNGDTTDHIAPATVRLNTGATTTYNGSAVWSFDVPPGSSYSITASATGYKTGTRTCPAVVSGDIAWCSIELEPDTTSQKGFIKGVVYKNGDTTNHVFPANVSLNTGASTTYDGSAVWSFEVNPGTYSVTASASGYQTATRSDCEPVVAGGTAWCSVELVAQVQPPQKGFLKGVVYQNGDTNSHVAPATVTLGTGESTTYGGTADWSFELAPGSYTVTATASGYQSATKACPQPVVAGQTARCDVELERIPEPEPDAGIVEPEPDAGDEPPVDAGVDAGVEPEPEPEKDAGISPPPVDAGTEPGPRTVPEIEGGSCGCSSTSSGLFGLLALPFFAAGQLRRRRER